ncbi:MAG: hypothetical protein L0Y71_01120 [Gemmataceae bacterium]|nr:hypothetical protein [Gemmataceae bacterium]
MSTFLKPYFETEGPFGLPMKDKQARALESRLRDLPKEDAYSFRRCSFERGIAELSPEGRCDVSWITEESPDRAGDIVVARGMDDSHFQLNPIVTLNHVYDQPPVGRSLWRRKVREGTLVGVKAKTQYPARPASWSAGDWPPDVAFELVKAGLLRGKSIGFFPLKLRTPTAEEIAADGAMKGVRYIIAEWLLAEYACCFLPTQPNAVVEEICKALPPSPPTPLPEGARGKLMAGGSPAVAERPGCPGAAACTTLRDIEQALPRYLRAAPLEAMIEQALERSWQRLRGRI